jgi:hypothetical protein
VSDQAVSQILHSLTLILIGWSLGGLIGAVWFFTVGRKWIESWMDRPLSKWEKK